MHAEVMEFVAAQATGHYPLVYDIGGRDVNGSPRGAVSHGEWVAIDLRPGPGVDLVRDVRDWSPGRQADLVLCLEVLEHAPAWGDVLAACVRLLRPGGLLLVTCAAAPRLPHSAIDGCELREQEHYRNVEPGDLAAALGPLADARVEHNRGHGDLYARATKR